MSLTLDRSHITRNQPSWALYLHRTTQKIADMNSPLSVISAAEADMIQLVWFYKHWKKLYSQHATEAEIHYKVLLPRNSKGKMFVWLQWIMRDWERTDWLCCVVVSKITLCVGTESSYRACDVLYFGTTKCHCFVCELICRLICAYLCTYY